MIDLWIDSINSDSDLDSDTDPEPDSNPDSVPESDTDPDPVSALNQIKIHVQIVLDRASLAQTLLLDSKSSEMRLPWSWPKLDSRRPPAMHHLLDSGEWRFLLVAFGTHV